MRIGIFGSRQPAVVLAELWARTGHQIALGGGEGSSSLDALAERIGPSVQVMSTDEAAHFGDVILLAIRSDDQTGFPSALAVSGKVVIDATEAPGSANDPSSEEGSEGSTGEGIAERFSQSRVVKAFNTLHADILRQEGRPSVPKERRFVVFLAGDDGRAKMTVSNLIEETGFTPIDTGSLAFGGKLQKPGSEVYGKALLPAEARLALSLMR
jgi:predicted dinucleotide-binding enzyme